MKLDEKFPRPVRVIMVLTIRHSCPTGNQPVTEDTLTNSMLKMLDSLARLTRPHGALLNQSKKMLSLKKVDRVNLTLPKVFSRKKQTLNTSNANMADHSVVTRDE